MSDFSSLLSALKSIAATPTGDDGWDESKHPRGNAANAGQFAPKGGGAAHGTGGSGGNGGAHGANAYGEGAPHGTGGQGGGSPRPAYRVPDRFTFRFVVGGVNSSHETIETTAPTFAKAVSNAMHRAANGNPRYIRQTWVRPVSVNGYAIRNYGIIDGDDPNRTEKAKDFQKRLVSFFSGHVPYYIPPQGQGEQSPSGLPHDGSRPAPHQGVPRQNHPGQGQPPGRMGHHAQGGASSPAQGGRPVQSLFSFAQDAYPKKKAYYSSLIRALRKIGGDTETQGQPPKTEGTHTAETHKGEGNKGEKGIVGAPKVGGIRDTQSRAREIPPKQKVISAKAGVSGAAKARMTPQEVRDMVKGNCSLIKTVQGKVQIEGIERRIKRLYEKGNTTPETLARYLEDECGLEDWQAERIVKDQMLKYEAAAKLDQLKRRGVKRVMWCAGKCEKHRPSHIAKWPEGLNGCVFDIDKPPIDPATGEPTMPGQLINCHCYLKAVK